MSDIIVIGLPDYNFSIAAGFKAWIDLVVRAGETFPYSDEGANGLMISQCPIARFASGGPEHSVEIVFARPNAPHMLGYFGINDATFVTAGILGPKPA